MNMEVVGSIIFWALIIWFIVSKCKKAQKRKSDMQIEELAKKITLENERTGFRKPKEVTQDINIAMAAGPIFQTCETINLILSTNNIDTFISRCKFLHDNLIDKLIELGESRKKHFESGINWFKSLYPDNIITDEYFNAIYECDRTYIIALMDRWCIDFQNRYSNKKTQEIAKLVRPTAIERHKKKLIEDLSKVSEYREKLK